VCGMGWRARGRECGVQQREIGPNQRSCAGAKGLRREERHGRQGSASCRVRSSCHVGKLAAGQEEDDGGDPAIQVRSSCGWTWETGTWPTAYARSREADGKGARLEWRTGRMSGWEAGSEHGQLVRRAWPEGVVLLAGGWAIPSKRIWFPPVRIETFHSGCAMEDAGYRTRDAVHIFYGLMSHSHTHTQGRPK
jgi:hypothetical protein